MPINGPCLIIGGTSQQVIELAWHIADPALWSHNRLHVGPRCQHL